MRSGKRKKSILAISPFLWSYAEESGTRTVYETLMGYKRAGYDIHLVICGDRSHARNSIEIYRGLMVHYFNIPFMPYDIEYNARISIGKDSFSSKGLIGYFLSKLFLIEFLLLSIKHAAKVSEVYKPVFVYGFTSLAVPAAFLVHKRLQIPNITRLLGTTLYPYLNSKFRLLLSLTESMAFIIPCDLMIISHDGTCGMKVARYFGMPENKVLHWINGLRKDIFETVKDSSQNLHKKLGVSEGTKLILSIGRFIRWKRIDRVIITFAEVLRYYKGDIHLVLIGSGDEFTNLCDLVARLEILDKTHFLRSLPYEETISYLNQTDILLVLYEMSNAGATLFESMLAGVCAISIDNGETSDFIQNGISGILIPDRNDKDIIRNASEAILRLLNDDDERKKIAGNAKRQADQMFLTWEERMKKEVDYVEKHLL